MLEHIADVRRAIIKGRSWDFNSKYPKKRSQIFTKSVWIWRVVKCLGNLWPRSKEEEGPWERWIRKGQALKQVAPIIHSDGPLNSKCFKLRQKLMIKLLQPSGSGADGAWAAGHSMIFSATHRRSEKRRVCLRSQQVPTGSNMLFFLRSQFQTVSNLTWNASKILWQIHVSLDWSFCQGHKWEAIHSRIEPWRVSPHRAALHQKGRDPTRTAAARWWISSIKHW